MKIIMVPRIPTKPTNVIMFQSGLNTKRIFSLIQLLITYIELINQCKGVKLLIKGPINLYTLAFSRDFSSIFILYFHFLLIQKNLVKGHEHKENTLLEWI